MADLGDIVQLADGTAYIYFSGWNEIKAATLIDGAVLEGGVDLSGAINFLPDTGSVIEFDGQTVLKRLTANGGISFGHDDAMLISAGDSWAQVEANVSGSTEHMWLTAESGVAIVTSPDNWDSAWAGRNQWTFSPTGASTFPGTITAPALESRIGSMYVGSNNAYLYESATDAVSIRTGPGYLPQYYTFTSGGTFEADAVTIRTDSLRFNHVTNNGIFLGGDSGYLRVSGGSAANVGANLLLYGNNTKDWFLRHGTTNTLYFDYSAGQIAVPDLKTYIFRTTGVAADYLHLRDTVDTNDLVIRYDGTNIFDVRSEAGGAGNSYMAFVNGTYVSIAYGGITAFETNSDYGVTAYGDSSIRGDLTVGTSAISASMTVHAVAYSNNQAREGIHVRDRNSNWDAEFGIMSNASGQPFLNIMSPSGDSVLEAGASHIDFGAFAIGVTPTAVWIIDRDFYLSGTGFFSSSRDLSFTQTDPEIKGNAYNSSLGLFSNTSVLGAGLKLYGNSHATKANDFEFLVSGAPKVWYDSSAGEFNVEATLIMGATNIKRSVDNQALALYSGTTTATSANIEMYGPTHASYASNMYLDVQNLHVRTNVLTSLASTAVFQNSQVIFYAPLIMDGDDLIQINGTTGHLRINPGSDTDAPIFKVTVTGTPAWSWDESADQWTSNKGLNITAGHLTMPSTGEIRLGNGTSADPSINFNAQQGTGLFYVAPGIEFLSLAGIGVSASSAEMMVLGGWNSSDTDIDGLITGSNFGNIILGRDSSHFTIGLRDNDTSDGFQVVSGGGNWQSDHLWDTLCFEVKATGEGAFGAGLEVNGDLNYNGFYHSIITPGADGDVRIIEINMTGTPYIQFSFVGNVWNFSDGIFAPTIEATGITTLGGAVTANSTVTIESTSPTLILDETDGTTGIRETWFTRSSNSLYTQTRSNTGAFVASDYRMTISTGGATKHEWFIGGAASSGFYLDSTTFRSYVSLVGADSVIARSPGSTSYGAFSFTNAGIVSAQILYGHSGAADANTMLFNVGSGLATALSFNTTTMKFFEDSTGVGTGIEYGKPGDANTRHIDFHSGAYSVDYDSRILASGGGASAGLGVLYLQADAVITTKVRPLSANTYDLGEDATLDYRDAYVRNGVTTGSDVSLKKNIARIDPAQAFEIVQGLAASVFNYIDDNPDSPNSVGLIAHEAAKVFKSAGIDPRSTQVFSFDRKTGRWGIRYGALIPYLIAAMQHREGA